MRALRTALLVARAGGRTRRGPARRRFDADLLVRLELPLFGLWIVLGLALSAVTSRVGDWFVMTDELTYERLGISIAQTHSPLPRIHGELIRSLDQLYPLLIAPVFAHGLVPHDLRDAHVLNAWVMSSACIPAFALAWRVTRRRGVSYLVAVLSVCMPWIVYSSFLLTEVAAYPVFLWAILAVQTAATKPSGRNDALALLGLVVAFLARTEFVLLVAVLPLSILAFELPRASGAGALGRARRTLRATFDRHRLLAAAYALLAAAAASLLAMGENVRNLSIYGQATPAHLIPHGTAGSFVRHLATLSLGLGILPFVAGMAWFLANLGRRDADDERRAFACIGSITVVVLTLEVATFDLGVGNFVHDRYLFYLAPIVVIGFLCALLDGRRLRWSLVAPAALVALGFGIGAQPSYVWTDPLDRMNTESPISVVFQEIGHAIRVSNPTHALGLATLMLAAGFVLAGRRLPRLWLGAASVALLLLVCSSETVYAFDRLLRTDDWAGRPLAAPQGGKLDWVDRTVGRNAAVTMIPGPTSASFFDSQQYWRDVEFWNVSVRRDAHYESPEIFKYTGIWFPKTMLGFDATTGVATVSPSRYALESLKETRFRISGRASMPDPDAILIDAGPSWRLDWLTLGLYDDGWTKPGVTARIRIFPSPGQRDGVVRYLSLQIWAPGNVPERPFEVSSNLARRSAIVRAGPTTFVNALRVCVPPRGFTEVTIRTPDSSRIPGDQESLAAWLGSREGGILVSEIALADETGGPCPARR